MFLAVKVGDKAPDFTLPSQMGDNVTLSEFLGKKNIVLYFYPKDETPGCIKEACTFRDNYEQLTSLGPKRCEGQSVESRVARCHWLTVHSPQRCWQQSSGTLQCPQQWSILLGASPTQLIKGVVRHFVSNTS
jgi:alkyl hydroperoxide reductase subunit AhpC